MLVSANFFPLMRVAPDSAARSGRTKTVPGRDAVMVLGHDLWDGEFGSDPSVLGRRVRLNGVEFTIVGVVPAGSRASTSSSDRISSSRS